MPFDLTFDSGLIILIAAFDLFLLIRFFQFRRQIKVQGMVPGRLIMLVAITPSGLSKEGIFCNVMPTPWSKIFYYDIEEYSEKKVRLRAHLAASERNLVFPKEQKELVIAHLKSQKVLSFEEYKALRNSRKS